MRWGLMSNVRVVRVGAEHVHEMQPCIDGRYCVYTVCGARCERQRALGALKSERIRVTIAVKHWANFEREVCMTGRRSGGEVGGRGEPEPASWCAEMRSERAGSGTAKLPA